MKCNLSYPNNKYIPNMIIVQTVDCKTTPSWRAFFIYLSHYDQPEQHAIIVSRSTFSLMCFIAVLFSSSGKQLFL